MGYGHVRESQKRKLRASFSIRGWGLRDVNLVYMEEKELILEILSLRIR